MKNLILISFTIFSLNIFAQSNNYWSTSFNTEASLLAGAVVGGNSDLTSIYYNPAGISEIEESKIALNANLMSGNYSSYKNALGKGVDIIDYSFKVQPRFVSYVYRSNKFKKLSWQFAIYNKATENTSIYKTVQYDASMLNKDYVESYNGNFDLAREYSDYRGGVGSSYIVNDKLSVGVSLIGIYKDLVYLKSLDISLFPKQINVEDSNYYYANWNSYQRIYMYNTRLLGRIGVRYKHKKMQYGLTITLPSFRVTGNSDSKRRISQSNIQSDDVHYPDYIITDSEDYLISNIKDPLSIAYGFVYTPNENTKLYFSTEYFFPIETYRFIDGRESIEDKQYEGTDFLSHFHQAKGILNIGIGYQHDFSEKIEGLLGFKTDFNAYDLDLPYDLIENDDMSQGNIDLYHFTAGVKTIHKRLSLILGINYSFGFQKNIEQFANFTDVQMDDSNVLTGLQGTRKNEMNLFYNLVGLYSGFSFEF